MRESCDDADTEVGCNDDTNDGLQAALRLQSLNPGGYFAFLDAPADSASGRYRMRFVP